MLSVTDMGNAKRGDIGIGEEGGAIVWWVQVGCPYSRLGNGGGVGADKGQTDTWRDGTGAAEGNS